MEPFNVLKYDNYFMQIESSESKRTSKFYLTCDPLIDIHGKCTSLIKHKETPIVNTWQFRIRNYSAGISLKALYLFYNWWRMER